MQFLHCKVWTCVIWFKITCKSFKDHNAIQWCVILENSEFDCNTILHDMWSQSYLLDDEDDLLLECVSLWIILYQDE